MRFLILTALLVMSAGCANLEAISSGKIGCAPGAIEISDEVRGLTTHTWVATCHGKRFICSAHASGQAGQQVDCTEERQHQ